MTVRRAEGHVRQITPLNVQKAGKTVGTARAPNAGMTPGVHTHLRWRIPVEKIPGLEGQLANHPFLHDLDHVEVVLPMGQHSVQGSSLAAAIPGFNLSPAARAMLKRDAAGTLTEAERPHLICELKKCGTPHSVLAKYVQGGGRICGKGGKLS